MRMRARLGLMAVLAVGLCAAGCGGETASGDGARTYYESLDLTSPAAAAQTFADAFGRDDFMTVWLVFDSEAQFRWTQVFNLLEWDQLILTTNMDDLQDELRRAFDFETMEATDPWYMFDQLMLIADRHDAFPVDLSGKVTFGEAETSGDGTGLVAEVEGIDGPVTFRMSQSPSGRWRVHQVIVPGGDEESIPWSLPSGF